MEALIILALIVIVILLSQIIKTLRRQNEENAKRYFDLKKELKFLRDSYATLQHLPPKESSKPGNIAPAGIEPKSAEPFPREAEALPINLSPKSPKTAEPLPASILLPGEPRLKAWQKWMRNNPDLEKFIGENLVNKIGITVLVLGIAFFVKYAIDQNWINEAARVSIGIFCGVLLSAIAHYLRNSYRAFSSVLAGGGIAVFYFTIAFAFHEYHLFSQTTAFIIMVAITVFAVLLSLLYDKVELAVIAIIGGFSTPFLVSTGQGDFVILFSYLLVLSAGILTIAYFKKWTILNVLAFIFTALIFDGWLGREIFYGSSDLTLIKGFMFATAFYLLFLSTAMINNVRLRLPFRKIEFSILMLLTFGYYAQGMLILNTWQSGQFQGLFTAILGIVNLGLAWFLFRTRRGDTTLLYLLIGLALTFTSLVAPVQLRGHSITIFWSVETVLLYWLFQKSNIRLFKLSSLLIMLCMILSLMIDWAKAQNNDLGILAQIFSTWSDVVTNLVAIASLGLYGYLLTKDNRQNFIGQIRPAFFSRLFYLAAFVLFLVTGFFFINFYFRQSAHATLPNAWQQLFATFITLVVAAAGIQKFSLVRPAFQLAHIALCFLFYFASAFTFDLPGEIITKAIPTSQGLVHWVATLAMIVLFLLLVQSYRKQIITFNAARVWLIVLCALLFASIESRHLYISVFATGKTFPVQLSHFYKAGLTIVWAIFSFGLIWIGIKKDQRLLRIIALSCLTLTLLKLFLYDIRNVSEAGKITAFIMLGVLLLIISFMYQRLKKLL